LPSTDQDKQYTHNVTLRRFHANILQWKRKITTFFESAFVVFGIEHGMRKRRIFICSLSGYIYPHYLIKGALFGNSYGT